MLEATLSEAAPKPVGTSAAVPRNPHALGPAAGASARHCPAFVVRSSVTPAGVEASWPLRLGRVWPGLRALRAPRDPLYDLSGGPAVPETGAAETMALLLQAETWPRSWPRLIAANLLPAEGPVWTALEDMALAGRIDLHVLQRWERSLLDRAAAPNADAYLASFISASRRRRLRQHRKALEAAAGPLSFAAAETPAALGAALQAFHGLEAAGWKGRRGTALAQDARGRAYVEDVLHSMAEAGSAFAAVLRAGDAPVAAGLFLRAGSEAFYWKTTYDERRARHSPGVQFDIDLTGWLYAQPWFERLDTGHDDSVDPAGLIWKQRRPMANVLIDLAPGSLGGRLALAGLGLRRDLRALKRRYAK
jgi:hypothetical protein